jgi:amino acid transporter
MPSESKSQHVGKVRHHELKQTLGTWQLWGIAVGLVISGEYFCWSYGRASAGTLGFVVTAIYSDELIQFGGQTLTANIVTMSVFGAIVMYIISMLSLFRLRRSAPDMERPFRAPLFPFFPAFALVAAVISLATMVYFNVLVATLFAIFLALGYVYFLLTRHQREAAPSDALLEE